MKRQFPQFPHRVLPIADHGIGPIRDEHDTKLRACGPRRPGILAHRYKGPERRFRPFRPFRRSFGHGRADCGLRASCRQPTMISAAVDVDEHHADPFSTKVG
ncbi:MAG TPA: hypothetical protein VI232_26005 [Reyranella sp.]